MSQSLIICSNVNAAPYFGCSYHEFPVISKPVQHNICTEPILGSAPIGTKVSVSMENAFINSFHKVLDLQLNCQIWYSDRWHWADCPGCYFHSCCYIQPRLTGLGSEPVRSLVNCWLSTVDCRMSTVNGWLSTVNGLLFNVYGWFSEFKISCVVWLIVEYLLRILYLENGTLSVASENVFVQHNSRFNTHIYIYIFYMGNLRNQELPPPPVSPSYSNLVHQPPFLWSYPYCTSLSLHLLSCKR